MAWLFQLATIIIHNLFPYQPLSLCIVIGNQNTFQVHLSRVLSATQFKCMTITLGTKINVCTLQMISLVLVGFRYQY